MQVGFSNQSGKDPGRDASSILVNHEDAATVWKRQGGSSPELVFRDPSPEPLFGRRELVQSAIKSCRFKRKSHSGSLSFAPEDIDPAAFNAGDPDVRSRVNQTVRMFLEVTFAGIPDAARPPIYPVGHTHLGRLEIHFLAPGHIHGADGRPRAWNLNPPGSGREMWRAFAACINGQFGFADPMDPRRAKFVSDRDRARVTSRFETVSQHPLDLRLALEDLIGKVTAGEVRSRDDVVEFLNSTGRGLGVSVIGIRRDSITIGHQDWPPAHNIRLVGRIFQQGFRAAGDLPLP